MATDLTEALNSVITDTAPEYRPECDGWTVARLRSFATSLGFSVRSKANTKCDGGLQLDLERCPICGESEGRPALWVRDGVPIYKCFRTLKCNASFRDLTSAYPEPLERICALDLPVRFACPRPQVIHGLLRRGDVANVIGCPKSRKSFLVMQLALCIASGTRFLAWETVRGRVLMFDNELRPDDLSRRMTHMADTMGLDWESVARNIDVVPLRGKLATIPTIRNELSRSRGVYSLTIVDALYKTLPAGTDENSNADMAAVYVQLDAAAEAHDCGIIAVHHSSKGTQHAKTVSDMGAGAGAQSRSADAHIVLREHDAPDTVVLQAILRSQPPIEPVCLEFAYPLWRIAHDKDPSNLAAVGKKPVPSLQRFVETIPLEPAPQKETLDKSRAALGTSKAAILKLTHDAMQARLIEIIKPDKRTVPYMIRRLPLPNDSE